MNQYVVHGAHGSTIVEADDMQVDGQGTLIFSAKPWLAARRRIVLTMAAGNWAACHPIEPYSDGHSSRQIAIKSDNIASLIRPLAE